jgi:hypothetical protein
MAGGQLDARGTRVAIDKAASPSPRRKAVQGKPGIYFREVSIDRAVKRRRVRRYEVSYLDSDGRRRWQTILGYDNLDEAERELVRIKVRLVDGERVDGSVLRFNELADLWLSQLRLSERTRERYEANLRAHLRPRFGTRKARLCFDRSCSARSTKETSPPGLPTPRHELRADRGQGGAPRPTAALPTTSRLVQQQWPLAANKRRSMSTNTLMDETH